MSDPAEQIKKPSGEVAPLTIQVNGVSVPIRKYIQDERLCGTKKEAVASKLVRELHLSPPQADALVEEAWDSIPQARRVAEGVKNSLWMLFGILCVGGFVVVMGAILIGSLGTAFTALGRGKIAAAGVFFLIAMGAFLYARWAMKGK